ncbi:hypothetical protein [Haloferula sp.]|uniref:hypothetical protein n=1 Tax=Haloferula sp. TaxID=2497595 RepID=UPI003C77DF52
MLRRILITAIIVLLLWFGLTFINREQAPPTSASPQTSSSHAAGPPPGPPLPGDALLADYASPDTAPIEDLRKLHNVLAGYFSVVKDLTRHPIGGNADLAACLLGENVNRQAFIRPDHPILDESGLLIDRWGNPFFIHPEAARELTIRSAGIDLEMFTADDLIILPTGLTP